jgi:hypothetical protein
MIGTHKIPSNIEGNTATVLDIQGNEITLTKGDYVNVYRGDTGVSLVKTTGGDWVQPVYVVEKAGIDSDTKKPFVVGYQFDTTNREINNYPITLLSVEDDVERITFKKLKL